LAPRNCRLPMSSDSMSGDDLRSSRPLLRKPQQMFFDRSPFVGDGLFSTPTRGRPGRRDFRYSIARVRLRVGPAAINESPWAAPAYGYTRPCVSTWSKYNTGVLSSTRAGRTPCFPRPGSLGGENLDSSIEWSESGRPATSCLIDDQARFAKAVEGKPGAVAPSVLPMKTGTIGVLSSRLFRADRIFARLQRMSPIVLAGQSPL